MIKRYWTNGQTPPEEMVEWKNSRVRIQNSSTKNVIYEEDVEHPAEWSGNAVDICASKYFRRAGIPKIGKETSVKQLARRIANCIAKHAQKRGYVNAEEADILRDEIIYGFITQRIGFNSPVNFNFGLYSEYGIEGTEGRERFYFCPEKNEIVKIMHELVRPGGSACFLSRVEDALFNDEKNGMFDWICNETKVFLTGAGDGANVSNIRGVGEPISGGGVSAGLPAFLPVRDSASGYIKSGGKTRRSSTILLLDMDHPDVEFYINWKLNEEKKAHVLIDAGYDGSYEAEAYGTVSGQNSNNSLRITDDFMNRLYDVDKGVFRKDAGEDDSWYLFSRQPLKNYTDAVPFDDLVQIDSVEQGNIYARRDDEDRKPYAILPPCYQRKDARYITKVVSAKSLWDQLVYANWFCGDPGIQFDTTINKWNTVPHYDKIRTTNPCLSGDTFIPTSGGLVRMSEWALKGDVRYLWSNDRWIGASAFPTKVAETIILKLSNGYEITCTPDHRFALVGGGEVLAKDAVDQKIKIVMPKVEPIESWDDDIVFQGFVQGDGMYHEASGYFKYVYLGKNDGDVKQLITSLGIELGNPSGDTAAYTIPIAIGKALNKILKPVALPNRDLTDDILCLPPRKLASFLRGLYSANGAVMSKHNRITLKTTCRSLASQVQQALVVFGIRSYVTTNKQATVKFDNGTYECRESYDLNITSSDCVDFANKIGFVQAYKNEELQKIVSGGRFGRRIHPTVTSISDGDVEQVYDFTLSGDLGDDERWACVAGMSTHNCAEVCQPDDTSCNLGSINLIKFFENIDKADWDGFRHACRLVTLCLDLVQDVSSFPTAQHALGSWMVRSIGMNHGNIGAVLMRNGMPYDSRTANAWMSIITSYMTAFGWEMSHEMALRMGSYPVYHEENHRNVLQLHNSAVEDLWVFVQESDLGDYEHRTVRSLGELWSTVVNLKGFRNSNVTCLVPQGTIGIVLDQDCLGCEPEFSLKKSKKCVGGTWMEIVNQSVPVALKRLGYSEDAISIAKEYILENSSIEGCEIIKEEHVPIFDCAVRPMTNLPYESEVAEKLGSTIVGSINAAIKNCKTMDEAIEIIFDLAWADLHSGSREHIEEMLRNSIKVFSRSISVEGHISALAAFQPHLSMSISKTVNVDNDATEEFLSNAYIDAWVRGVKCIAMYRDGAKRSQPLNTKKTEDGVDAASNVSLLTEEQVKTIAQLVPGVSEGELDRITTARFADISIKAIRSMNDVLNELRDQIARLEKVEPQIVTVFEPMRLELDSVLSDGKRFRFEFPNNGEKVSLFIQFYFDKEGRLVEVFVNYGKQGDTIGGLIDTMGRLISRGLQYKLPPEVFGDVIEGMAFGPNGFLGKSSVFGIHHIKSIPDLVGKLLRIVPKWHAKGCPKDMLYPDPFQDDSELIDKIAERVVANGRAQMDGIIAENKSIAFESKEKPEPRVAGKHTVTSIDSSTQRSIAESLRKRTIHIEGPEHARTYGYTGKACTKCGSYRTKGTTSCFQCLDCGEFNGPCGG